MQPKDEFLLEFKHNPTQKDAMSLIWQAFFNFLCVCWVLRHLGVVQSQRQAFEVTSITKQEGFFFKGPSSLNEKLKTISTVTG